MFKDIEQRPSEKSIIHVIDDEASIRDSLCSLLNANGYETCCHESAEHFLSAIINPDFHQATCVIADIKMPGISGIDLLSKLNREGHKIPVTIMTGHGEVRHVVQAFKEGAFDFIQKPFREDVIITIIEKMLAKSRQPLRENQEGAEFQNKLNTLTIVEKPVLRGTLVRHMNNQISEVLGSSCHHD